MRLILISVFLFITASINGQPYLTFPVFNKHIHFNWEKLEKRVGKADIDRFINDHPGDFEAYRQKGNTLGVNMDSLYNDLHFLDINGDSKNDVIFDGQTAGEPREIEIFINNGSLYKKAFSVMQGVVKLDWQGGRLSRIYIRDWGCCDAYQEYHKIYGINYDKNNYPTFRQLYQSIVMYDGVMPDSILETPLQFEILNQAYNIRSAPQKDDSSFQHWNNDGGGTASITYTGNIFGKLIKGGRGMVLAKTIDNSSREWLYVEIDKDYLQANNVIYIENKFPTKLKGWISGRFVKML